MNENLGLRGWGNGMEYSLAFLAAGFFLCVLTVINRGKIRHLVSWA